jgi:hypothetical protein
MVRDERFDVARTVQDLAVRIGVITAAILLAMNLSGFHP